MSAVIARAADIDDDIQLEQYLLEHAEVAVISGNAFGTRSCPRFSFATSMALLTQAMARVTKALGSAAATIDRLRGAQYHTRLALIPGSSVGRAGDC